MTGDNIRRWEAEDKNRDPLALGQGSYDYLMSDGVLGLPQPNDDAITEAARYAARKDVRYGLIEVGRGHVLPADAATLWDLNGEGD